MIRCYEAVLSGHPDKFCDRIADAIVAIKHDSQGGDAVSTLQQNVFGVTAYVAPFPRLLRRGWIAEQSVVSV